MDKVERRELAHRIVDLLNELNTLDEDCVYGLIEGRVACNQAIADHLSVQVQPSGSTQVVGLLGILNGVVGVQGPDEAQPGWGYVRAHYEDAGFPAEKITHFNVWPEKEK